MYANQTATQLGNEILISINERVTKWGTTTNSLCCYVPRRWEKAISLHLNRISSYPISILDKDKSLIPIFINNVSKKAAIQFKEELKFYLEQAGFPYKEHKGRVKDEINGTSSNHGSPINAPNVGYLGNIRPWKITEQEVLELNGKIVRDIPDKQKTTGEIVEESILAAFTSLKDRDVKVISSNRGSLLDVIGKDLIIIHKERVWGFQVKSSALDAYLHQEKYPQEICLWVNPNSTDKELTKLVKEVKELTWGLKGIEIKATPRPKPKAPKLPRPLSLRR